MHRRDGIQYGFANSIMAKTMGGLILCGMNEGIGDSTTDEAVTWLPWTPYFSHSMNACRFQTTIKEWFSCWRHPLNPERPTELDWAIAQTNLFIDASRTFEEIGRTDDDWVLAIEDLAIVASMLKASGVVFLSKTLGDNVAWYVNRDKFCLPEWRKTFGSKLTWTDAQYGRLNLRTAEGASIPLVNVSHPNFKVAYEVVSESAAKMGPWFDDVLENYRSVQASMSPT